MSRRRLLVITYLFPPDGAVGGLRWAGFSKYLARMGWEVHVVTASHPNGEKPIAHVTRHTVDRRRTLNDLYNAVARRVRARRQPRADAGAGSLTAREGEANAGESNAVRRTNSFAPVKKVGALRYVALVAIEFPDPARGWVFRAAGTARRLLREESFDAVITSGPPHSAHLAGMLATLGRSEPLVLDMRDPWVRTHKNWASHGPSSGAAGVLLTVVESLIRGIQHVLVRRSRLVILNTPQFAQSFGATERRANVAAVRNAIDTEGLPSRGAERLPGSSIAYVGTLYVGRAFSPLLEALDALRRERPGEAANVRLHVAGHMASANHAQLQRELASRDLAGAVQLYGTLPRAEALDLLVRADLALVLAQEQPMQVPAKLYECIALGVPTLVIAESDSASAREARRVGALTVDPDDSEGIRQILLSLVEGRLPSSVQPLAPISYQTLAEEMHLLLTTLAVPARAAAPSGAFGD